MMKNLLNCLLRVVYHFNKILIMNNEEKIIAYNQMAKRIYERAEQAKEDGLDILLEYSEEQGMFHFNFITDKEKWIGRDCPSPFYMPVGYTNHLRYKAFREYADKMGLVFFSPLSGMDKPEKMPTLAEVEAVFGNFEHYGGITDRYMVVDDIDVPVKSMEITNANILKVTVGTNGHQGGDAGHGCRTYFSIEDFGSTYMNAKITGQSCGDAGRVEITLGGDCELDTFIEALEFAVEKLNEMKYGGL